MSSILTVLSHMCLSDILKFNINVGNVLIFHLLYFVYFTIS